MNNAARLPGLGDRYEARAPGRSTREYERDQALLNASRRNHLRRVQQANACTCCGSEVFAGEGHKTEGRAVHFACERAAA